MKNINYSKYLWELPFINILVYIIIWGFVTKSFISMGIILGTIVCSKLFKVKIDFGRNSGRQLVILTFMLSVAFIVFALWDKSVQAGQVLSFVLSWLPVFFFPLIIKDIWSGVNKEDLSFPELKKPTPFSKKPPERIKYKESRWFNMAYSYPIGFSSMNAIYPRAIYGLSVWISLIYIFPNDYPKIVYFVLIGLGLLSLIYLPLIFKRNWSEWLIYFIIGAISAVAMFILLSLFQAILTKMSYNWAMKSVNNGWFNNTYSATQIGKDQGDFDDGQELLMRTLWSKRNSDLLPASYFNLFMNNNWSVSANFVSGKSLDVQNGTVSIPSYQQIPLLNLKGFNPVSDEKNNRFYFSHPTVDMQSEYKENIAKNDKDNRIVIIGQLLKNQRGLTALPIPASSKYIIGENGNGRFSKYSNGSVVYSKNSSIVNWQVIYDKTKYIPLHEPITYDLSYPKEYKEDFEHLKTIIGINDKDSPDQIALKVKNYFQNNYGYTLDLKNKQGEPRSLHDFMTDDKRGHCEYFASTTTMFLRYLGIPTRYTVGFLVSENHPEEDKDMFWVRKKDAHAWTTYWNGQGWESLDTTPYSSAEWEKPWYFNMSNNFNHLQYVIDNLDIEAIKDMFGLKTFAFIIFMLGSTLFIIKKRKAKMIKNISHDNISYIYEEGIEESKMREDFEEVLKVYPKTLGEPWMKWAKRTQDDEIIEKVKIYYKKIYG